MIHDAWFKTPDRASEIMPGVGALSESGPLSEKAGRPCGAVSVPDATL